MADRGWEYTPVKVPGGIEDDLGAVDEYADLFDEEFRTRWGFGISTIYADDGGYADGAPTGVFSGGDDPNQDFIDSLSPEEQSRYYTDLFGPDLAGQMGQLAAEGAEPTIPGDAAAAGGAADSAAQRTPTPVRSPTSTPTPTPMVAPRVSMTPGWNSWLAPARWPA